MPPPMTTTSARSAVCVLSTVSAPCDHSPTVRPYPVHSAGCPAPAASDRAALQLQHLREPAERDLDALVQPATMGAVVLFDPLRDRLIEHLVDRRAAHATDER